GRAVRVCGVVVSAVRLSAVLSLLGRPCARGARSGRGGGGAVPAGVSRLRKLVLRTPRKEAGLANGRCRAGVRSGDSGLPARGCDDPAPAANRGSNQAPPRQRSL